MSGGQLGWLGEPRQGSGHADHRERPAVAGEHRRGHAPGAVVGLLAARCPALSSHRGQLGAQLSGVGDGTDGDLRQRLGQHLLLDLGREEGEQRLGGRAGVQRHHHPNFERQPQLLGRFHPVDAEHTHPTRLQHRQKRGLASGAGHLLELGVQVAAKIEAGRRAVAQRHGGSAEPVAPTADRAQQSLGLEGVYQPVGGGHRQPHCFGEAGRRPLRLALGEAIQQCQRTFEHLRAFDRLTGGIHVDNLTTQRDLILAK